MRRSARPASLVSQSLLSLRRRWHERRLDTDPLELAHRYFRPADREVVAFLASTLAFGRVAAIRASLERLLAPLGPEPARFLCEWDLRPIAALSGLVHRWVGPDDLHGLLAAVAATLRSEGSLEGLFARGAREEDLPGDAVAALDRFFAALRARARGAGARETRGLRFLLPAPADGSACKRAHLFLRWVVRRDGFDLGLWDEKTLTPARLLLPMDVHVHRVSLRLGLTGRRTADLAAAREATAFLARIDPADPVSFDWALSRLGIVAGCVLAPSAEACGECPVRPVCADAPPPLPRRSRLG